MPSLAYFPTLAGGRRASPTMNLKLHWWSSQAVIDSTYYISKSQDTCGSLSLKKKNADYILQDDPGANTDWTIYSRGSHEQELSG